MNFIEELKWRGMIHDMMPGTEDQLKKEITSGYVGYDPTSDSLHIGNLVSIMMLKHLQLSGHKPIVLVGGATGMIGDPSGKSEERNLLDEKTLRYNQEKIKTQLSKFLDFESVSNNAIMVNNYDWTKELSFLDFIRDVGKHITISYMMAKDSVQKRLETGISFTEFSYQLVQGFDFYHLYTTHNCKLQMGGSDQWGNITTGTELIRRKAGGEAFALTCPLVKKADGSKFGKTEEGNVWLDPQKTSPYKFYQFWLNTSDEDAENFIKIFTLLNKDQVEEIISRHKAEPHLRILQKELARDITTRVHSETDYKNAVDASEMLFGNASASNIKNIHKETLLSALEGVPAFEVSKQKLNGELLLLDLLTSETTVFPSKSEARRFIQGGGLLLNKEKVDNADQKLSMDQLIQNEILLVQKGKKNYNLIRFV